MVTNQHFSHYTWPHLLVNVITDSTMNEITSESTVKLETLANPDLRNFGEINVGEMLTLKSASNYNYVENWNLCVGNLILSPDSHIVSGIYTIHKMRNIWFTDRHI